MSAGLDDIWSAVAAELRGAVSAATFEIWLAPLRAHALDGTTLVVEAPPEIRSWVADRFGRLIGSCAQAVMGPDAEVDLVSVAPSGAADPRRGAPAQAARADTHAPPGAGGWRRSPVLRDDQALADLPRFNFNPKLSFDQFVIGDTNRLAHAAALAVAEMPGQAYNPLFIYGPPGLGKTHLLHSIANYVSAYSPSSAVRYTTVESFTNEFLTALQGGSIDGFKARFRRNDVLLIDDVQFLERKARTEEEFFHTFNALYDAGAQIVVTSDRLPADLDALEDRLRERFEAGLITDIRPPDLDMRLAILRKRVHHDELRGIGSDALDLIADRIRLNVRALEGALIRVVAYASLTRRPISPELTLEVLDGLYPRKPRRECTIAEIQAAICEEFGVSRDDLLGPGRTAGVAWPRQVAMYLSRELTQQSLPAIGRAFGGRDHTTVLHAHRRASERLRADTRAADSVDTLADRLTSAEAHDRAD